MRSPYQDHFSKMKKNTSRVKTQPRPRAKRKQAKQSNSPILKALASSIVSLLVFAYLLFPQDVQSLFNHFEVSLFSQADAASSPKAEAKTSTKEAQEGKKVPGPKQSKLKNPESNRKPAFAQDVNYFSKLEEKERDLNLREEGLVELESDLQKQREEIELKIVELKQLRGQVSSLLKTRVETDEKKIMKLVEFYSNMKPQKAAGIINTLDEDLAVEILNKMKKRNAASILNLVSPNKAQILSEKFAGYQK